MPILKKLRSKIKKKIATRKTLRATKKGLTAMEKTYKKGVKKVAKDYTKAVKAKRKSVKKKPITSRLSKLQRAGESWSAWKKRTGKGSEVKARDKKQAAAKKAKAKATKKRGTSAKYSRDSKTGKIYKN